ncbi:gamma-glutamyltransferase family protein [Pseudorhodoferax sp.]|uniref:gamma-glutamyltransferase family protein n=1 Tax=Pseudorhodoferax sp. TaxID=1993553 RepID=UPI0039E55E52
MARPARPKSQYGRLTAIASGHHLATLTAQRVVEQGGSLVDAMVAASAMLTVTLPHAGSLGGCGLLLVYDAASHQVQVLNGTGRAPAATPVEELGVGEMPRLGVRAAVTPTLVRLWARAHERFGRLSWAQLLAPSIAAATTGVGTAEELAGSLAGADAALRAQPGFTDCFHRNGQPLTAGQPMRQPQLAEVLQAIARQGESGFYSGWVARSLAAFCAEHGGWLGQDDLARAQADWYESWSTHYAGRQVHVAPPNSLGVLLLRQLNLRTAASGGGDAPGPADDVLRAVAVLQRYRARIGDPARRRLLPGDFELGERRIGPGPSDPVATHAAPADATGFVAMDVDGNAVALLQSVFQPLGSGAADPGTGVLLNNRMAEFRAEPGLPNSVHPMARPAHTLSPWIVVRGNRPELAAISPGGIGQTTAGLQFAAGALETDATLGELAGRPRWSLNSAGEVLLEPGMDATVAAALRARGLSVVEDALQDQYFGSIKAVRANPLGGLEAVADLRRQAHAVAW